MGARSFQTMVPMRDGTRLNTFRVPAGERRSVLPGDPAPHALRHRRRRCARQIRPHPRLAARARPSRCAARSCAAGGPSSRTAMPRSTRIAAAGTARKARTGSMPTTRPTATTRSNGSPASSWCNRPSRHVRLVGRRDHDLCRRLDPAPEPACVLRPGRRLQHL